MKRTGTSIQLESSPVRGIARRMSLAGALALAALAPQPACGDVQPAETDAGKGTPDGSAFPDDAGEPGGDADTRDAAPVGCSGDEDCQDPGDACLLAGTCNLDTGQCEFPEVDCTEFDDECTRGVCANGECGPAPTNEGEACGPVTTCDGFGDCESDGGTCSTTGSMTQTCRDFVCQSGACLAGADFEETEPCTRNTNGASCGSTTETCGDCEGFSNTCDTTGTQDCTRTERECSSGSCEDVVTQFSPSCTRPTNGDSCGSAVHDCGSCGGFSSTCDETGTKSCTCSDKVCDGGTCVIDDSTSTSCNPSCTRDTELKSCTTGTCTTGICQSGSCENTCN